MIFLGVMCILKWDFTKLSTGKYQTNQYDFSGEIKSISVKTATAEISFLPSTDGTCSVVCYERENGKHSVTLEEGKLCIDCVDTRKWYEHIGIHFDTPSVTVYLPAGAYEDLSVEASTGAVSVPKDFSFASIDIDQTTGNVRNYASATGNIRIHATTGRVLVEGVTAGALELSVTTGTLAVKDVVCQNGVRADVSTGDVLLEDLTCGTIASEGSTGDVTLDGVRARETLTVTRTTGDVTLRASDAAELFIQTTTGDVEGTLLTEKIFIVDTTTGEKDVPATLSGGKCEIKTTTGDIEIRLYSK
jgi:DUF4097 and DUF4098 domain-containing protein YvlB